MTAIKICGIREPEHAILAAEAGADYIGLNFYPPSSRYVSPDEAQAVCQALDTLPSDKRPKLVGVFVNEQPSVMVALTDLCGLDLLQLSGDEPWRACVGLPVPAIKALRIVPGTCVDDVVDELSRELAPHTNRGGLCLIESRVEGHYGGTGQRVDWSLARIAARRYAFLLSGGLDPDNVGDAVAHVRPWGVDVSSGVESAGKKDPAKISAFIEAVRTADLQIHTALGSSP